MNEGRDTYVVGNGDEGGNYGRQRVSGKWTILGNDRPEQEKRGYEHRKQRRNYSTEENPAISQNSKDSENE